MNDNFHFILFFFFQAEDGIRDVAVTGVQTCALPISRFAIKHWDEKPYSEGKDVPKLTRASVTKTFTGDIEGEGQVEYLMMYRSDGSATFVGFERVVGRLAGKAGSFVLQRTGVFEAGVAKESYSVVPGSGTGELRGLRGEGATAVGHGMEHPMTDRKSTRLNSSHGYISYAVFCLKKKKKKQ